MQQPRLLPICLSSWHYATRLAFLAVIGLVVGLGLLFLVKGKLQILVLWGSVTAVAIAGLLSLIFFRFYFDHSRIILSMINTQRVIFWTYTPDEWQAYLRKETSRKSWRMLILLLVFTLGGSGISGLIYLEERVWNLGILMPAVIGFLVGGLIYATVQLLDFGAKRRQAKTPAWFMAGIEGFYITGSFYSWRGLGRDLLLTRLINDCELNIIFQVRSAGQNYEYQFHIPIPESAQDNKTKIVQFLTENPELRFVP